MKYHDLIKKYNIPVPRYTSYPTVPVWKENQPDVEKWKNHVHQSFKQSNESKGISLYLHMPYCEKLCYYCGCNTNITKKHRDVEVDYIEAVLTEWKLYLDIFNTSPKIAEIHIGGGTPTFFSPEHLRKLLEEILGTATVHENHSFSFEAHPMNTKEEHLKVLSRLGFDRVSFGIQDFDPHVQKKINRIQDFNSIKKITELSRKHQFKSINYDLIYGLPFQHEGSIKETVEKVSLLMPERIAFYSYAHIPWKKAGQRKYTEKDLPTDEYKRNLYELGKELLLELGYKNIAMDHFALPEDELYQAYKMNQLHRNFMGYTVTNTELMIGLGASSISDSGTAYVQNNREVNDYKETILSKELQFIKGHFLSRKEKLVKNLILSLICHDEALIPSEIHKSLTKERKKALKEMENEGLIQLIDNRILLQEAGKVFIRNICAVFDPYYQLNNVEQQFSKSI